MEIFSNNSDLFVWVIIPLLIFLSRIADQTLGTLRFIFLSKGYKYIAPFLGFFEVIIWLIAVTQIIKHIENPISYVAYGAGFAAGNYLGMILEEKLSLGKVMLRIIPKKDTSNLIEYMRSQNYGITIIDAHGSIGDVKMIMSIMDRKDTKKLIPIINTFNPHAFFTIEDIRAVKEGVFRSKRKSSLSSYKRDTKKIK